MARSILALVSLTLGATLTGCGSSLPEGALPITGEPGIPSPHGVPEGNAPQIQAVSPAIASPAMRVRITGAGFSAVAAENTVRFGGLVAPVEAIEGGALVVSPVAPSQGVRGAADVTVTVGGKTSAPFGFTLGASGDQVAVAQQSHLEATSVLAVDGAVLFLDPSTSTLHRVAGDGFVTVVASNLPGSPASMALAPSGEVVFFNGQAGTVWSWTSEGGVAAFAETAHEWIAGAFIGDSLYALRTGGEWVDRLDFAAELFSEYFFLFDGCAGASMIAATQGRVWVASPNGSVCSTDPMSGYAQTPVALENAPAEIGAISGDGTALLVAGTFPGFGYNAARVSADGAVEAGATFPLPATAVARSNGNSVTAAIGRAQIVHATGSNVKLLAAPLDGVASNKEIGDRTIVTGGIGGWDLAFVAEISGGAYRVLANAETYGYWTGVQADGESFLVASLYDAKLLRLTEGAAPEVVIDRSSGGSIASFAKRDDGSFLVAGWEESVALYSAGGELVDGAFITGTGYAGSVAMMGGTLWISGGDRLTTASATEGGAATIVIDPASGYTSLGSVAVCASGSAYIANDETGSILRVADLETMSAGVMIAGLSVDGSGAIRVADAGGAPYVVLP